MVSMKFVMDNVPHNKPFTAREMYRYLYPDVPEWEVGINLPQLTQTLRKLHRWGMIKRVEGVDGITNHMAYIYMIED